MISSLFSDDSDNLTAPQRELRALLVEASAGMAVGDDEPFLAIRVGLAGVSIMHYGQCLTVIPEMSDIEGLALAGCIELRRMPSGVRVFRVTGTRNSAGALRPVK